MLGLDRSLSDQARRYLT